WVPPRVAHGAVVRADLDQPAAWIGAVGVPDGVRAGVVRQAHHRAQRGRAVGQQFARIVVGGAGDRADPAVEPAADVEHVTLGVVRQAGQLDGGPLALDLVRLLSGLAVEAADVAGRA